MNEVIALKKKILFWSSLILTLMLPGLGFIILGYSKIGLTLALSASIMTFGLSYLAALSPWCMVIGFLINLMFHIFSFLWLFRLGRQFHFKKISILSLIGLLVIFIIHIGGSDFRRTQTFMVPSDDLTPDLIEGDSIAVDSQFNFKELKIGDVVNIRTPFHPGINFLRRVTEINQDSVTGEIFAGKSEAIPLEHIKGKALYIMYSVDLQSNFILRFDRFIKTINP